MKKYILTAIMFVVVLGADYIYAQEKKDTIFFISSKERYDSLIDLEPVVISSNHMEVSHRKSPQNVGVISSKTINMTPAVNLSGILSLQSGVRVENICASDGLMQARINGLDGHYNMIMIDSRPILSSVSSLYGLEQIPVSMIERTEVMKGGGSALYGASAVGGTINIITKRPTENMATISHSLTSIGISDAFDNVTSFNTYVAGKENKSGIALFFNNRHRDGYSYFDDGITTLPKYDMLTAGTKMFFKTGEFSNLDISYNLLKDERRGGNNLDKPVERANIVEQSKHTMHNATATYHFNSEDNKIHADVFSSLAFVDKNSYTGGFTEQEPSPDAWKNHAHTKDLTFNGGAMLRYRFDKLLFLPAYLTMGAEYAGDFLKDEVVGYNITEKQNTHTESLYLQNEWANENINILLALRADKHNLIDNIILSPRFNIKYTVGGFADLRFSYSEGFRAPQVLDEDLHISMSNGERYRIRLAKGLKEERSRSLSLSSDFYFKIKNVGVKFMAEGFYTFLSDVFAQQHTNETDLQGNKIIERYNADGAKYYGLNFQLQTIYSNILSTDMGFTFQKSRYNQEEEWSENAPKTKEILRTPDTYGYFTIGYTPFKNFNMDFTGTYTGSMLCPHLQSSGTSYDILKKTPSFFDVNIKISYTFSIAKRTDMTLSCGVINIFDSFQKDLDKGFERDSEYIYGPALNRSLTFSCQMSF